MDALEFTVNYLDGRIETIKLVDKLTIGQNADNDVVINDPSVDAYHCTLKRKDDVVAILNLSSIEGSTKIDNFVLNSGKMYLLNDGDTIAIGNVKLLKKLPEVEIPEITEPELQRVTTAEINNILAPDHDDEEEVDIPLPPIDQTEDDEDIDLDDLEIDDIEEEGEEEEEEEEQQSLPPIAPPELSEEDVVEDSEMTYTGLISQNDLKENVPDNFEEEVDALGDEDEELSEEDIQLLQAANRGFADNDLDEDCKTHIFKRLSRMFSGAARAEKAPVQLESLNYPAVNPILRMLGVLVDFLIAFSVAYTLIPSIDPMIANILKDEIAPLIPIDNPLIVEVALIYAIMVAIDIAMNLLLGASLPLWLMGIRPSGSFVVVRVKSTIAAIINAVTFPFIIFDLPALIKKPTLKEWLTHGPIGLAGNKIVRIFAVIVVIPAIIIGCLYLPFTLYPSSMKGIEISIQQIHDSKIKRTGEQEYKEMSFASSSLDMKFQGNVHSDVFYLPYFKYSNNSLTPSLMFYRDDANDQVTFSKIKRINFATFITTNKNSNPLFKFRYPALSQYRGEQEFTDVMVQELVDLICETFNLGPSNAVDYFLQNGPFISGALQARNEILSSLGLFDNVSASVYFYQGNVFLVFGELQPNRFTGTTYVTIKNALADTYTANYNVDHMRFMKYVEKNIILKSTYERIEQDSEAILRLISGFNEQALIISEAGQKEIIATFEAVKSKNDVFKKSIRSLQKALKAKYKENIEELKPLLSELDRVLKESEELEAIQEEVVKPVIENNLEQGKTENDGSNG